MKRLLTVPKKIRIIECSNIEFVGKDILTIRHWKDFLSLLRDEDIIYKIQKAYYIISPDVAWLYSDVKGEVNEEQL
jgi:hypothetical protein